MLGSSKPENVGSGLLGLTKLVEALGSPAVGVGPFPSVLLGSAKFKGVGVRFGIERGLTTTKLVGALGSLGLKK